MTHHIIPGIKNDPMHKATSDALDQIAIDAITQGFGVALHNLDGTITRIDPDVFRGSQIDPLSAMPSKTYAQHQESNDVENHKGCVGGIPVPVQEPATGGDGRGMAEQPVVKPSIVDEVLSVFAASGFEVRVDNPQFAIVGTIDAAGVLVDSFLEAFAQGPTAIERRRELQAAPLPRDAECALEHAALVLSQVGETAAHDQVVDVIRQHLPEAGALPADGRCRAQGGDTIAKNVPGVEAMVAAESKNSSRSAMSVCAKMPCGACVSNVYEAYEAGHLAATTQASTAQAERVPVELEGVQEQIEEGSGFWHTCSGCHESEDGHDNGHYPCSTILRCKLGMGCDECGGIGAVWDNTDYEAMAADWNADEVATSSTDAQAAAEVRDAALEEAAQIAERCYAKSAFSFELGTEAAAQIRKLKRTGDKGGAQ